LLNIEHRNDLAGDLANNHARYAGLLVELGKPDEALGHFGSAIDIASELVNQEQLGFRRKLATSFAQRGLVRYAQGERAAAAKDFEKAAEIFALMDEFREAVLWQEKAVELATGDIKNEAKLRLDHYRSGEPHNG
jgi:tetratricopeptide (TPR) repeat protein